MRVYLAAPWANREEAAIAAARITASGHEIAEAWWEHAPSDDHDELVQQAYKDIQGIYTADFMIVLQLGQSEGKAVETGMAMIMQVPTVVVNPNFEKPTYAERGGNVFHHLLKVVPTLDDALTVAKNYEEARALARAEYDKQVMAAEAKERSGKLFRSFKNDGEGR